ncbi:MAG: GNAT family N-acetyltransferase [Vulcanimicrobiaceae bacterium]
MAQPLYRDLTSAELPIAATNWKHMLAELDMLRGGIVPDWLEILVDCFRDEMSRNAFRAFGAELGGKIVGTACAMINSGGSNAIFREHSATLAGIYVEPASRRLGIARGLTECAIAWCAARGCSYVRLQASHMGRPLYETLGFVPGNEMRLDLR